MYCIKQNMEIKNFNGGEQMEITTESTGGSGVYITGFP
jgi:hypothetical protein